MPSQFTADTAREAGVRSGRSRRRSAAERHETDAVVAVVEKLLADLPPLSEEKRKRLGVLLRGTGDAI